MPGSISTRLVTSVLVAAAFAVPATAHAHWEQLSNADMSTTDEPSLSIFTDGIVIWPATPAGSSVASGVESRTFTPTFEHPAGNASPVATPVSGWNAIGGSPVLFHSNTASKDVLFAGFSHDGDGQSGTYTASPATGTNQPFAKISPARSGDLASQERGGTDPHLVWADNSAGQLHLYRDANPTAEAPDLQAQLGGCCAYHPTLVRTGNDNTPLWLAWYSNATGSVGIYLLKFNPETLVADGPPVKVPGSESPANNYSRLAATCDLVEQCRIVYATPGAGGRMGLSAWWPGEAAPTVIPGVGDVTLSPSIAAHYSAFADIPRRLEVAWYDRVSGEYRFVRGLTADVTSGRARIRRLGKPAGSLSFGQLAIDDSFAGFFVSAVTAPASNRAALWMDVLTFQGDPAIPDTVGVKSPQVVRAGPAITVIPGRQTLAGLRTRGLPLRVQSVTATAVGVKVCHPPSPCKSLSMRFKAPGEKDAKLPISATMLRATTRLKFTLSAGGRKKSVTVKFKR